MEVLEALFTSEMMARRVLSLVVGKRVSLGAYCSLSGFQNHLAVSFALMAVFRSVRIFVRSGGVPGVVELYRHDARRTCRVWNWNCRSIVVF